MINHSNTSAVSSGKGKPNRVKNYLWKRRSTSVKPNPNHPKINILLSQGNKRELPLVAMIDSGSAITTISPKTVKELGLETIPNRNDTQI